MIIPHSGVLTKFNGGRGGIATSPLKSTTSKASVKKWKPTARAACSNRRPSRGRMISSSTSAVLRPTRHPRRIRSDDGAITGRGEDPFVKAMGAEKGKLREPWHPMRLHHIGIVLPTLEKAHDFIETNGLEVDYSGFVDAYHADLIFTKKDKNSTPIEFIIPREGVLKDFNHGKGGIAHIAFEVDDVEKVRQIMEGQQPGCMLEKKAVQGTDDIVVNFRRPSTDAGILVEYVQTVAPINRSNPNPFQN